MSYLFLIIKKVLSLFKARFILRIILFVTLAPATLIAQDGANESSYTIDFKKIEKEKYVVNYTLDQIVTIIQDSIHSKGQVIIPADVTEFERALFQARINQHNNNLLEAIKQYKTLLEFECYRTKGEELYIKLLLGTSIGYLGAPLIAHNYINPVFPDIFEEIKNPKVSSLLINNYAGLLIEIDSLKQAKKVYTQNLDRYKNNNNTYEVYNTMNSLGFVCIKLKEYAKARSLFLANQNEKYANINPVIYAFSFGNYGAVLLEEGKYDSALFYMRKEVNLMHKIPSHEGLQNTYLRIGEIFEVQHEIDSARKYYQLSLNISNKEGKITPIVVAYEKLIKLYALTEKTHELTNLVLSFLYYSDSLKTALSIDAANEEFQVTRLLEIFKETENSKKSQDTLETKTTALLYTAVGLALIILLMTLYFSSYFINRKNFQIKNLELEEKNKKLEHLYEIISKSNAKNQVLLTELHHRVKNNLQIISSLFNLQLNASNMDVRTERVFKDAKNRIYSISLVHKKIYQSDNVDSLDFEAYLRDFSEELLNAIPNDVNLKIDILRQPISIESAVPLGLMFNELFTNSIKHSKQHDSLQINVTYEELDGKEKFIYTDNGVGVQHTEIMKESDSSIGVTLIHLLGEQLGATIEYKEAKDGEHSFWLSIEGNFS